MDFGPKLELGKNGFSPKLSIGNFNGVNVGFGPWLMVRIFGPKLLRNFKTYESIIKLDLFEQTENQNSNFFCFFKYLHSQNSNRTFVVRNRPLSPGQENAMGAIICWKYRNGILQRKQCGKSIPKTASKPFQGFTDRLLLASLGPSQWLIFKAGRRGQWIPSLRNLW